ncbi:hypothetical protein M422DRAFT_783314 [Sphaerobolus stellatus SS14]|uniref:Uncharacterized protein n=1 Tax=Sphaerobolus stellatus (strain SS14) TaxID=990650 RepID=A0A0C9TRJ9_SPHS4|nr:hypothetical protein M422DRAFT_783314 [Sphaerobolus stellatus SS14]
MQSLPSMSINTQDVGIRAIEDHEISSPESDVEFALPPDSDYYSADSTASSSHVGRVSRVAMRPKHRPAPLQHQRSFSVVPVLNHPGSDIGRPIISSSSNGQDVDFKAQDSADRESFIDLDDMLSPSDTGSPSPELNPNAMYPTPTRNRFKRTSKAESTISTASGLPTFARPGRESAAYQTLYDPSIRNRPQSMLVSPNFGSFLEDDERVRSSGSSPTPSLIRKPPVPKTPKPAQLLRKAAASSSAGSSPNDKVAPVLPPPPPTTNKLDPVSRQELLRKNRKLAQMLGEGIGGMLWPEAAPPSRSSSETLTVDDALGSPESFIEFDDHDDHKDTDVDSIHTYGTLSPEEAAEAERKKMRDKLAKLHRFLGSRVPVELALGAGYVLGDADLPKVVGGDQVLAEVPRRRRRSSSSAALPGYDDLSKEERIKDNMNDKERAMHVKRANKMEQVFGARPPVTLYQNRPARRGSPPPPLRPSSSTQRPPLPDGFLPPLNLTSQSPESPPTTTFNRAAAYEGKGRYSYKSSGRRPSTTESTQGLLSEDRVQQQAVSSAYMYWRHSLISLKDIIDKDDKKSLAELHHAMNSHSPATSDDEDHAATPVMSASHSKTTARYSSSSSIVSLERRRSLPARTSMISLISTNSSIASLEPDPDGFQQRRKRAAKLTNFFGVNYRDLFGDVLESIEKGMNDEFVSGTMQPEEVEELMVKLRRLKTNREAFS